jgi:hypothetical protein
MVGPPLSFQHREQQQQPLPPAPPSHGFGHAHNHFFGLARLIPILISIIWLGIGIRQWSKWTKKYERYKELQKKVDEKLDYDDYTIYDEGKKRGP